MSQNREEATGEEATGEDDSAWANFINWGAIEDVSPFWQEIEGDTQDTPDGGDCSTAAAERERGGATAASGGSGGLGGSVDVIIEARPLQNKSGETLDTDGGDCSTAAVERERGGATAAGGGSGGLGGSVDVMIEARPLQVRPPRQNKSDSITIEALKRCVSLKRAEAAKIFNVCEWTFKRRCRQLGVKAWPNLPVTMLAATDAREQQEVGQKRAKDVNIIPCDKKKKREDESTSQDIEGDSVRDLKIYGAERVIKLQFSLSNGLRELKQEVGARLELPPKGFDLTYKDNEGEKISMPLDIDLKNYLTSASSPVIKLWAIERNEEDKNTQQDGTE